MAEAAYGRSKKIKLPFEPLVPPLRLLTEKHYNPWVRSRQEQLEADLERAWSRDPLVLVEAKATRRLRGERERVN
jgi:hypothetical protein